MFIVKIVICFVMFGCYGGVDKPVTHYKTKAECVKRGKELIAAIKTHPMLVDVESFDEKIECLLDGGKAAI